MDHVKTSLLILRIYDTVIVIRKHMAEVHNLLFEIMWLKYFQYSDKWQTLTMTLNHDQYLKSVIIPSKYPLILFLPFSFLEVIRLFLSKCW